MRRALACCAAALALCACAKQPPQQGFVLDGPPLYVAGEFRGTPLEGTMDRKSMVGIGEMLLASPDKYLDCRAEFNGRPTNKARIRGLMICTDKHKFSLTLRNLGPDQGVGVGLEDGSDEMLVLFYHPSPEEARRRLTQASADMRKARSAAMGLDSQPTTSVPAMPPAGAAPQDSMPQAVPATPVAAEPQPVSQNNVPQAATAPQGDMQAPQAESAPAQENAAPLPEEETPAPAPKNVGFGTRYGTPAK